MKIRAKLFKFFSASLSFLATNTASSYDNSKFPSFQIEKPHRSFQHISIHPNDEEWLITEKADKNYFLLYNLKTKYLQRYELHDQYKYTFATFSPNGKQIVMIRKEHLLGEMMSDRIEELKTSEIVLMNKDGSHFQVLPIPKGIIVTATFSPDNKKIAYWVGKSVRKPSSKSLITDFDVREYDLTTHTDRLFAGPFNFTEISNISYLTESTVLIGAYCPRLEPGELWDYKKKFNNSEIFQFDRGQVEIPTPRFSNHRYANSPARDSQKNIFFIDYPLQTGQSVTRISPDGTSVSWRTPSFNGYDIYKLSVSASGKYVALTYGSHSIKTGESKFAIGLFKTDVEEWSSVSPPPPSEATPIFIKLASRA